MVEWLLCGYYFLFTPGCKCPLGMHIQCCRSWLEINLDYWMGGRAAILPLSHQMSIAESRQCSVSSVCCFHRKVTLESFSTPP